MNTTRIPTTLFALACSLALASAAQAQTLTSTVGLDGAQESPMVVTAGTGTATVTVDAATLSVSVSGSYTGLSSAQTLAHVHIGAFGMGGGAIVTLGGTGGTSGTFSGSGVLLASEYTAFLHGGLYLNVHTTMHVGGEIRGQIVNISCPAALGTDPALADNAGNLIRGPKIADAVERFNVSLDCSNAGAPGNYTITIHAGTLSAPNALAFGSLWFSGAKLFSCSGAHTQNLVSCSPAGIILLNNLALVGVFYNVQGFCFDSTNPPGRLSNALIQVIE